jgi:hypothetical protein
MQYLFLVNPLQCGRDIGVQAMSHLSRARQCNQNRKGGASAQSACLPKAAQGAIGNAVGFRFASSQTTL